MVRFVSTSFASAALLLATAPSHVAGTNWGNNHHVQCQSIATLACSTPSLSTLCGLLKDANLDDVLNHNYSNRRFTVFAPTNAAFDNLPFDVASALANDDRDNSLLRDVLQYHVAEDVFYFEDFSCKNQNLIRTPMLNGGTTTTKCVNNGIFQVGDGNNNSNSHNHNSNGLPEITTFDIEACNGVVNIIDEVLLPDNNGNGHGNVVGSNYCTYGFDYKCYPEHGRPACCFDKNPNLNCPVHQPACNNNNDHHNGNGNGNKCQTIASLACSTPSLSTLCSLLQQTNLDDVFEQSNNIRYTVFAPNNAAFANLPSNIASAVETNESLLIDVLKYHVAEGAFYFEQFSCQDQNGIQTLMLNGDTTRSKCINNNKDIVQIGDGNSQNALPEIINFDIPACDGVVNIIDEVLLPEGNHHNGNGNGNLVGSNYCTYAFDYKCYPKNGRPECCINDPHNCPTQQPLGVCDNNHNGNHHNAQCQTIASLACSTPSLSTLCGLLKDTNLDGVFDQKNGVQYTVFAPTNDAFANLPSNIASAIGNDQSLLAKVLKYHVAEGAYFFENRSCQNLNGVQTTMLNDGTTTTKCINNDIFQVGDGNSQNAIPEIINSDILACNGVVNIIDQVLLLGNGMTNNINNNHHNNNGNGSNNHSYHGPNYCSFSLENNCYEFGRPLCCFNDLQNCPAQQPRCDHENQNQYYNNYGPKYCSADLDFGCYERGRPGCCFGDHSKCPTNSNHKPACNRPQNQVQQNRDYCYFDLNYGCYEFGLPNCCFNSNLRCSTNRPVCNCGPNRGH